MSEKGKKNVRKSQAQFREKLRKLRLRQNNGFLIIKKRAFHRMLDSVMQCSYFAG